MAKPKKPDALEKLIRFAAVNEWDATCEFAEDNYEPLANHLMVWGNACGAPRDVYRGHIVRMLIDIGREI